MASPAVDLAVNPSNTAQMIVLYANGAMVPKGGAPTPTPGGSGIFSPWPAPNWAVDLPAKAIIVTDWSTPSGYVMTVFGGIHPFGGATQPSPQVNANALFSPFKYAVDFTMDPAGNGNGFVLDINGTSWPVGATPPTTPTAFALGGLAKKLDRVFGGTHGGKGYVLDGRGGMHPFGGAPAIVSGPTGPPPYWPSDVARDFIVTDYATGQGYLLDQLGGVHNLNGAEPAPGAPRFGGDAGRAIRRTGTDPLSFIELAASGGLHAWSVSSPPSIITVGTANAPDDPTTTTTRPTLGFDYFDVDGDSMSKAEIYLFRAADVGGALWPNAVQVLTISGSPTGGAFKLALESSTQTGGGIPYNASAATVQTAVRTLPGCSAAVVTGSAGGPWTVTFAGTREGTKQDLLRVVSGALTGGTNPKVTIAQTVAGGNIGARGTDLFHTTVTDPTVRGVDVPFDLENGTYRYYVRVTDSGGLASGWRYKQFVQNVTRPAAPVLSATDQGGLSGIAIGVQLVSPPAGALLDVQFTDQFNAFDPEDSKWQHVLGTVQATVGSTPEFQGDNLGFNTWPDATPIFLGQAIGGNWFRWADEWQWMQPTSSPGSLDLTDFTDHLAAVHAADMRAIHVLLGSPTWVNANSNQAYGAGVGSQTGTLTTPIANVSALPTSVTITSATGTWPLQGKIRPDATGQVIGYNKIVRSGSTLTLSQLWLSSGSGAVAAGGVHTYYNAVDASGHWIPTNQAGCDLFADFAVTLCGHLDPDLDMAEFWNEPQIESFMKGLHQDPDGSRYQSPADFARLARTVIRRLRAAYPRLTIIMGSIAASGDVYNSNLGAHYLSIPDFALSMLAAEPTLATTDRPDLWGVHPYNWGGGKTSGMDTVQPDDQAMHLARAAGSVYRTSSPKSNKGWNGHVQAAKLRDVLRFYGITDPKMIVTEEGAPGARATESVTATTVARSAGGVVTLGGMVNHGLYVGDVVDVDSANNTFDATGRTISARTSTSISYTQAGATVSTTAAATTVSWASSVDNTYDEAWQATHTQENWDVISDRFAAGWYVPPFIMHTLREDTGQSIDSSDRYMGIFRSDNSIKPAGLVLQDIATTVISAGSAGSGLVDLEAPFGKPRVYRAKIYTLDPYVASDTSERVAATLSQPQWAISVPGNGLLQMAVEVVPPFRLKRPTRAFVAQPSGGTNAVVVRDGGLKGATGTLTLRTRDQGAQALLDIIVGWPAGFLLRDKYGRAWYLQTTGDVDPEALHTTLVNPYTPTVEIGFVHEVSIDVTQIDRPTAGTADVAASALA